jgi:SAM-dependent methyltransferase
MQDTKGSPQSLDWFAIWRDMYDQEKQQSESLRNWKANERDPWRARAKSFATASGRTAQPDHFLQFVIPQLREGDHILDIGAGAGRHSIYLAQQGWQVTAIEPSAAMREQLTARIDERTHNQLQIVAESWPSATIESCDVAICSHALYGVREIEPFLQRMHAISRRACFILIGFQQPSFYSAPFWERIYEEKRLRLPGALECFNALYQLGIAANLTLLPASRYSFVSREEALNDLEWRLQIQQDSPLWERLQSAINELLIEDSDGRLVTANQAQHVAVIWWQT